MHLEDGKLIPDNPREGLFLKESQVNGMPARPQRNVWIDRVTLGSLFHEGQVEEENFALLRGLVRFAYSQSVKRNMAIECLALLAGNTLEIEK
jgi:hypothetical protein